MSFGDDTLDPSNAPRPQLWRHKKRGTVYAIDANDALMQCSTHPEIEGMFGGKKWTVYRDVASNKTYIRLTSEFNDGRFERVEG